MQLDKYQIIGGHNVIIPPPASKSDIMWINEKNPYFVRERMMEQYKDIWFDFIPHSSKSDIYTKMWQAATIYDDNTGLLVSLNEEDSNYIDSIYKQETYRRINGFYFKNGDKIEWITGDHYYFLMYARMQRHDGNGLYADFREFQSDYFKLIHHSCVSPNILGLFCSKPKKTGITNAHWSGFYLNRATLYANQNFGYMNINLTQAAKTFTDYFMYSYNGIISPLKPEYKFKSEKEGSITFAETHRQGKKSARPRNSEETDLNTSVFCVPTKPKAFDVAVMKHTTYDEPTKFEESFEEIWRTNKEAVKIQSKFNGRAWLFNYTPDEDTASFRQARETFKDSELSTIINDGRNHTQSGLINHHIPAYASWEGAFDKHGRCDESRAIKEIEFERNKVRTNPRALQAITRQYANTKKEAWSSAGAGSVFDNIRISDLATDVDDEQRNSVKPTYAEGKLEWTNSLWEIRGISKRPRGQFCPVKFVPLSTEKIALGEKGRLRIYNDVPKHMQNAILRNGRDEWNNILPPSVFFYTFGADPTQYAAASEVIEGSKNAFIVKSRADEKLDAMYGKVSSNRFDLVYFYRPELPGEAYEDLVKLIIYCGAIGIAEANVPMMATSLLEEGLGYCLLVRNKDGIIQQWERKLGLAHEAEKEYHLIRTTNNGADSRIILEQFVNLWKNYIQKPEEGGKDYGATIKDERILDQLMNVDIMNTKIYDLFMGSGYALLADEIYTNILLYKGHSGPEDSEINSVLKALCGGVRA